VSESNFPPPRVLRTNLPPNPSLQANKEWLQAHAAEYRGLWIALDKGQLVAVAATAIGLKQQVKDLKEAFVTRL
jgi:hypothetical protein